MSEPILVLRLSSLGDVVLASSFLLSLGEHFPGAEVTFVVRDDLAAVAAALPGVHRVVAVQRDLGIASLLQLGSQLARTPFAHVFDLHASMRSRLLTHALRRQTRPGFDKQALPRWLLVHAHRDLYGRFGGARSMRERYLAPLVRMGLNPRLHETRLVVPESARTRAADFAGAAGAGEVLIGIAPGARWPSKCWAVERFAALAARLQAVEGRRLVVVGGESERPSGEQVARAAGSRAQNVCGTLGILETAAVLERCALLVTNDSGLLHVAEAVGCPVLALFGPTAPQFGYTPYRTESRMLREPPPCSPCSKNGSRPCFRPTHECMEAITVESALAAAESMLRSSTPARR